ncbi:dihydroorotate oxidase [Candidatus Uhrbacteria bacterium]|nr:dihydroorotate oxidase [Candidatus Uhrbacteria bacterium]
MNTKTTIAGLEFPSYICNASGPNDATLDELHVLGSSGSSAIVMKSCTIEPRSGNAEPRYARLPYGAIQSMGLPNLGYRAYGEFAPLLQSYGKPIVASIAGLSVEDYRVMVDTFQESDVDLIEVNLSCPNIEGKPQVAYDFEQTEKVLSVVSRSGTKPVGVKLPPYFDYVHQQHMAELIEKYQISFVTCINSVGNVLVIDPEKETPILKPKKGFGGLSGSYIKPIALANVRAFYNLLGDKISIFGVGGIQSGVDAFEFLLAGADVVQVGTIFEKEGPACFGRIEKELVDILIAKGYHSVADAKGRLKFL